ncbi:MAG: CHAD domain-containing protein [Actinomycetota bacterium]|nr:CHAD domain-containing protein [Actinomycetota bacterium]
MTRISPGEHVCDAVRRLAHHRLHPALEALDSASEADVDEVVHDVRKRCKRARGLLRLVRPDMGDEVYHRENRVLRDAARAVSDLRDAAVQVSVYDAVVRDCGVPLPGLRATLVKRHEDLRREVLEGDTLLNLRASLAAAVARTETWPVEGVDWDVLGAGLKRIYRRGRTAMAAAYDDPSTERFHSWRKRTKYLHRQLELLEELWPDVVGGAAKTAHALTDTLGEAHDLAVLQGALEAEGFGSEPGADHVVEFIESRRDVLRAQARPIGLRLYAEKPSRFVARLGQYWEAGVRPATAA